MTVSDLKRCLVALAVVFAASPAWAAPPTVAGSGDVLPLTTGVATWTVDAPDSITSGNLLLAYLNHSNSTITVSSTPSGWTEIHTGGDASTTHRLRIYRKVAGGSEPSSYAWTFSGTPVGTARIFRLTGVDTVNPINGTPPAVSNPANTATPSSPAVTTTVDDCLVLRVLASGLFDRTQTIPSSPAHTLVSRWDDFGDDPDPDDARGYDIALASITQATAGEAAAAQWTINSATARNLLSTIAVAPGVVVFSPGSLSETSHTETSATVAWTDATGAAGSVTAQLQQSAFGAESWSNVSGATSSPAVVSSLTVDTSYDFRVRYTDSAAPGSPVYSNTLTVTTTSDPDSTISAQWLADNAAAFGGKPYRLGSAFSNDGRSYSVPSGSLYRLATDVTEDGSAFAAVSSGVTIDLDGNTITYDNAAQPTVANTGFETAGGGGATTAANWTPSGGNITRIAKAQRFYWGDWHLRATGYAGTETIVSDAITVPAAVQRYQAWCFAKGQSTATVYIEVLNAADDSVLAGGIVDGLSAAVNRGFPARTIWDNSTGVTSVKLRVTVTLANAADVVYLDFAGLRRADVFGVIATGSTTGLPPELSGITGISTGHGLTLTGPGTVTQGQRSFRSHAVYCRSTSSAAALIDGVSVATNGMDCGVVYGQNAEQLTIQNCAFTIDAEAVQRRMDLLAAIDLQNSNLGGLTVDGCTFSGTGFIGVHVGKSSGTATPDVTITDNTSTLQSLGTDGYFIVLNRVSGAVVSGNDHQTANGRGIILDGYSTSTSSDVTISDNYVVIRERANLEYDDRAGMESTALRLREFGANHSDILVSDNHFEAHVGAAEDATDAEADNWACIAARISTGGSATTDPHYTITGNTFKAIVDEAENTPISGGKPTTAIALAINANGPGSSAVNYYGSNTFESNHVVIACGDNDGFNIVDGATNVLAANTVRFNTAEGEQTELTKQAYRIGDWQQVCSDLQIYSTTYENGATESITWGGPADTVPATGQQVIFGGRQIVRVTRGGVDVIGATVTADNAQSVAVLNDTTDGSGLTDQVNVATTTWTHNGTAPSSVSHNPIDISASEGGDMGTAQNTLSGDETTTINFGETPAGGGGNDGPANAAEIPLLFSRLSRPVRPDAYFDRRSLTSYGIAP